MNSIVRGVQLYGTSGTGPTTTLMGKSIQCGECGETFFVLAFSPIRFCLHCGSELRFAKHARPPKPMRYGIVQVRDAQR